MLDQVQILCVIPFPALLIDTKIATARYSAFCRRDGEWKDASKKTVQWNGQIVEIFADDMLSTFAQIKVAFNDTQRKFIAGIDGLLCALDTDLLGEF